MVLTSFRRSSAAATLHGSRRECSGNRNARLSRRLFEVVGDLALDRRTVVPFQTPCIYRRISLGLPQSLWSCEVGVEEGGGELAGGGYDALAVVGSM